MAQTTVSLADLLKLAAHIRDEERRAVADVIDELGQVLHGIEQQPDHERGCSVYFSPEDIKGIREALAKAKGETQ